jgi:hypothetical protein
LSATLPTVASLTLSSFPRREHAEGVTPTTDRPARALLAASRPP